MLVNCPKCNIEFDNVGKWSIRKFCSRSCANARKWSVEHKKKVSKKLTIRKNLAPHNENAVCANCLTKIRPRGKFCSIKCQKEYHFSSIVLPRFYAGFAMGAQAKRCLVLLSGYKCFGCGNIGEHISIFGKKLTLQLDHIDGNSDNNLPSNLRFLRPNCHTQTPTHTGRNKKNTKRNRYLSDYRKYRKQIKRIEPS